MKEYLIDIYQLLQEKEEFVNRPYKTILFNYFIHNCYINLIDEDVSFDTLEINASRATVALFSNRLTNHVDAAVFVFGFYSTYKLYPVSYLLESVSNITTAISDDSRAAHLARVYAAMETIKPGSVKEMLESIKEELIIIDKK